MLPFSVFFGHLCLSASVLLCCWGSWSIILSLTFLCLCLFSQCVLLNDGCLRETGVFPSASPAYCRRAHKAVQAASWETALPELSAGLEAHRFVCLTLPLPFTLSAVHHYLFFVPVSALGGTMVCFVSALDCTAPRSLVSRHWNRQTSLYERGWADLLLMWMDRVNCLQPSQSSSLNIIISDAVQVLSLEKVTVRLMHLIFITQRQTGFVASHTINLNLGTQDDEDIWLESMV